MGEQGAPDFTASQCWSSRKVPLDEPLLLPLDEPLLLPLDEPLLLLPLDEPLLLPLEDEPLLLPLPELDVPASGAASQITTSDLLLTSPQLGAPLGTCPSATVSVIVTLPDAAHVKVEVGLPPVPVAGPNVPAPAGDAVSAHVRAPGFGPADDP